MLTPDAHRFGFSDLTQLTENANNILDAIRTNMLEPHPRKVAPSFTGNQLASLCGIDSKRIPYIIKTTSELPAGTHEGNGKRRMFSLAEARQWINHFLPELKKPRNKRAATIAIVNFKGGSTKTTTAFNLAQGLTLRGRRVLLIDLDPQGSATTLTGLLPAAEVLEEHTIAPVTYPPSNDANAPKFDPIAHVKSIIQPTYWDGLDIIPAAPTLFNAEILLPMQSRDSRVQWWNLINQAIDPLRDEYDYIIFDTAPALSYLAVNAIIASDALLMPIPPDNLDYASSVVFWTLLHETLGVLAKRNIHKDFAFMHVLLSRIDANSVPQRVVKDWIIKTYGQYVLPMEIPRSPVASVGAIQFASVYDIERYEGSAKTYSRIRDAFDQLVHMIDQSVMLSVWQIGVSK